MSDAGRLGYKYANSPTRLQTAHIRNEAGALVEVNWEDAIVAAAEALKASPGDVIVDGGCTLEEMKLAQDLAAAMGAKAKFAAATGEGDGFLVVEEKGANAKGGEMLGLMRAKRATPAAVLVIERDEHVNASFREKSGAVVVFALDGAHVPDSAQVVFPLGSFAERDGLLVNIDGLVQALERNPAIGPNLAVFIELLEDILGELDEGYEWRGRAGVLAEIRALPAFSGVAFPAGVAVDAAEVGAVS